MVGSSLGKRSVVNRCHWLVNTTHGFGKLLHLELTHKHIRVLVVYRKGWYYFERNSLVLIVGVWMHMNVCIHVWVSVCVWNLSKMVLFTNFLDTLTK